MRELIYTYLIVGAVIYLLGCPALRKRNDEVWTIILAAILWILTWPFLIAYFRYSDRGRDES